MAYVQVALPLPLDRLFTYEVPPALEESLKEGCRVYVPFGSRRMTGYAVELLPQSPREETRPILEVLDDVPALSAEILALTRWVAEYYFAPWGEVIRTALPNAAQLEGTPFVAITAAGEKALADGGLEESVRQALERLGSRRKLRKDTWAKGLKGAGLLPLLTERGWVEVKWRAPISSPAAGRPRSSPALPQPMAEGFSLTCEQALAWEEIRQAMLTAGFRSFLLQGVTGSGKTEVYLRAMALALSLGQGALMLVPEIALTPQLLGRVEERFGEGVAVLHSGLTPAQRVAQWHRIRHGGAAIAVGTRSAVFAPFERLGLIVIDEEHDSSYKQEESPRYHARDVALMRAKLVGAVVILGSATPSLESAFNAETGKFTRLVLAHRVEDRSLPRVEIVDMRGEKRSRGKRPAFSARLREAVVERIARGEQTLLFLNRRGFASFVQCLDCGFVFGCPNCDLALVYHRAPKELKCHHCDEGMEMPDLCPQCRGVQLSPFGLGTQQVEDEVRREFPQVRIARLDRDVARRVAAIPDILRGLREGEIDILIGTQMIAKGHDFPRVTLVGVISADASLNLPDFRAGEHAFQLLTQVAGRAGRGEVPGEVIIQTYNPAHYALLNAQMHDYQSFYAHEIVFRRRLRYPPWTRVVGICVESVNQAKGEDAGNRLGRLLRERLAAFPGLRVLGPFRAVLSRVRNRYRWRLWLQGSDSGRLRALLREVLERYHRSASLHGVKIHVDVDPLDLL